MSEISQWVKGRKSLGLLFEGLLYMYKYNDIYVIYTLFNHIWYLISLFADASTPPLKCIAANHQNNINVCITINQTGQELQMLCNVTFKWSVIMNFKVSWIALWWCSLNFIAFAFSLIRSCLLITLIKCLKGHNSPGLLL